MSTLQRQVPLLRLEPFVNIAAAKAPVLAYLSGRDAAVLGQRIERRLGDLEVAVKLLNRQNVGFSWVHGHKKVTTVISCCWLLYNKPWLCQSAFF